MVDSPSDAEGRDGVPVGGSEGAGSGEGLVDEAEETESDGEAEPVERGAVGVGARVGVVPVAICKLEGCTLPVYVSRDGVAFEFCSRSHARRQVCPPKPGELLDVTCKLPGCVRGVYVDFDGVPFQFCCKSHGQEYERRQQGRAAGGANEGRAVGGDEGCGRLPEFQPGSELVCVRPGCANTVQAPHPGASGARMGSGPTRYNFCSRYCKIQHGVGAGSIPFSSSRPLAGSWYQAVVEAAQEEARGGQQAEGEGSAPEGSEDSRPASPQAGPPALRIADVPVEALRSVVRCSGLMKRQMAKRAKPYEAQFNGFKKCPLCHVKFSIGHKMVRCYVDPNPECVWVHVDCAQTIVSSHGGGKLHPSLP
mmetsp:Transcript_62468/g.129762  ORF Transcript_62468/g.129762 Transcript_62468/m.129762 type:complete len:365 (+) Transcript_62468:1471-2565(+)